MALATAALRSSILRARSCALYSSSALIFERVSGSLRVRAGGEAHGVVLLNLLVQRVDHPLLLLRALLGLRIWLLRRGPLSLLDLPCECALVVDEAGHEGVGDLQRTADRSRTG